jgi:anti-sigma regulatory factor (Ser/Thr protein kinase)
MANMRQVIRGVAHVYPDPAMILDAADKTLRAEGPDRLVSVFVGILDPVTLSLTYASAGHPAPLLRTPDGSFVELPRCGPPLGLRSHDDEAARTIDIPAGSLLVLYTDGLTEATRNIDEGERRLRAAMSDDAILASTDIARAIHDAVLGTGASDDVAILAIDVAAGAESDDDALLRWSFDSHDAVAAQNARHAFSARLRSGLVPEEDICAAELVFGELVGNVARHAPGPTDVVLDWSGPRPVLHVLDTGPGFEHLACLPSDAMSESGRGLFLVSSLAQELHVSRRPKRGSHARAVLAVRRTSRWSTDRAPKPALLGTSLSITALVP